MTAAANARPLRTALDGALLWDPGREFPFPIAGRSSVGDAQPQRPFSICSGRDRYQGPTASHIAIGQSWKGAGPC